MTLSIDQWIGVRGRKAEMWMLPECDTLVVIAEVGRHNGREAGYTTRVFLRQLSTWAQPTTDVLD